MTAEDEASELRKRCQQLERRCQDLARAANLGLQRILSDVVGDKSEALPPDAAEIRAILRKHGLEEVACESTSSSRGGESK